MRKARIPDVIYYHRLKIHMFSNFIVQFYKYKKSVLNWKWCLDNKKFNFQITTFHKYITMGIVNIKLNAKSSQVHCI
jgi:hypothetical protein